MQSSFASRATPKRIGAAVHTAAAVPAISRVYQRTRIPSGRLVCRASSEKGLLSGSDLLGPSFESSDQTEDKAESLEEAVDAVELKSEVSLDFTKFKELLKEGDFKKADDEGRALLLSLAGKEAESRGWIYFTEVALIPAADMKTIDDLWRASSKDRFGYSVQKRIFAQKLKRWTKFLRAIDWTAGENNNYRKWPMEFIYSLEAKPGHLPVTNCLRGTQLFEALMHHKAFEQEEGAKSEEQSSSTASKWTSI